MAAQIWRFEPETKQANMDSVELDQMKKNVEDIELFFWYKKCLFL